MANDPHRSEWPLLVVGAGPAGLSCGIQALRDGLPALVVGDEMAGGLLPAARAIENLAGFPGAIAGARLAALMAQQVEALGLPLRRGRVVEIRRQGPGFAARLGSGEGVRCGAVVLATGTAPAPFEVAGQGPAVAVGRLHRDLRSLPTQLEGCQVVVVGAGDAAFDTALSIRDRGGAVTIVARADQARANPRLETQARGSGVELLWRRRPLEIETARTGLHLVLELAEGGKESLSCAHLVLCVGRVPRAELLADLASSAIEAGQVASEVPGLYLAGDVINGRERYVATALGDGQRAARCALAHLRRAGWRAAETEP